MQNVTKLCMAKRSIQSGRQRNEFNVRECEKFIDRVSDFTLQLLFQKLPLVKIPYSIKEYPQLSEDAIIIHHPFPNIYLCEAGLSLYISTKRAYLKRLNTETDMRIQLASIKIVIKEICKNAKKKATFLIYFRKQ